MINLATFNIFWYPTHVDVQNHRDEADDARIVRRPHEPRCPCPGLPGNPGSHAAGGFAQKRGRA